MDSPLANSTGDSARPPELPPTAGPRSPLSERGSCSSGGKSPRHPTSIGSLIEPDRVIGHLAAGNKTELLRLLAHRTASIIPADADFLFDLLMARERLGSTATAHGYALPHTEWKGLTTCFGLFTRLAKPIDFAAMDGRGVDLVFLLLSPKASGPTHLAALAGIAHQLRSPAVARMLRATHDAKKLYEILTTPPDISAL